MAGMDADRGTLIGRLAGMSDEEVITEDAFAWCRALQADLDATAVGADGCLNDDREALRVLAVTWWRRFGLGAPTRIFRRMPPRCSPGSPIARRWPRPGRSGRRSSVYGSCSGLCSPTIGPCWTPRWPPCAAP